MKLNARFQVRADRRQLTIVVRFSRGFCLPPRPGEAEMHGLRDRNSRRKDCLALGPLLGPRADRTAAREESDMGLKGWGGGGGGGVG
jgi:hypothetical protein